LDEGGQDEIDLFGASNGLWYLTPEQLQEIFDLALENGLQVHSHNNGNEATEFVLDCMACVLRKHPNPANRFTLQYTRLANAA